jgi:putative membrane protein insertion efficiency factor
MGRLQPNLDHTDRASQEAGTGDVPGLAFRFYKAFLSPVLHTISPSRCLYLPTCSEYAYTAVSRFGMVRGSWLALRRFARCHPWGKGGLDPVPERVSASGSRATQYSSGQKGTDHLP